MDVSGGIRANLDAGYPGRHDGELLFHVLWANARSWNTLWKDSASLFVFAPTAEFRLNAAVSLRIEWVEW